MYENLEEKKLSSELLYDGKIVHLYIDTVELPNGEKSTREYMKHQGAVAIVPLKKDGTVIMERQYRYPFHDVMLEIPAGKIDPGEEPLTGAMRELKEETGIVNANFREIGTLYPSVAYTNEIIYMYIATDFEYGENKLDEDEFLEIEEIHIDTLYKMVMNGEIPDSKTQTAILKTYCIYHNL